MPTPTPNTFKDENIEAGTGLVVQRDTSGALHLEHHTKDRIGEYDLSPDRATDLLTWMVGELKPHISQADDGMLVVDIFTESGRLTRPLRVLLDLEKREAIRRLILGGPPEPAGTRLEAIEGMLQRAGVRGPEGEALSPEEGVAQVLRDLGAIDHKLRDHGHTSGSTFDRVARVCSRLADARHAREDQRAKHHERISGIHEKLKPLDLANGTVEERLEELVIRCDVAERNLANAAARERQHLDEIDRLNALAMELAAMADVDLVRQYHQNKLSRVALPETDEHRAAAERNVESRKEQLVLIEETLRSYGLTEGSAAERVATLASNLKSTRKVGQGLSQVISAIAEIFDIELGLDSDLRSLPRDMLQIKADLTFETEQVHELLDKVPGAGDRSMPLPKRLAPVLADDEVLRVSAELAGNRMVLLENATKDRDALREQVNDICSLLSSEGYGWDIDAGENLFTAFTNLLAHAHLGRALRALEFQLDRLRANPCPTMGCGFTPWEVGKAVRHEVLEVAEQPEGSGAAQRETHGVLAAAVHLVKVHGGSVIAALTEEEERLRQRLDWRVWHGKSWKEAKRLLGEGKVAPQNGAAFIGKPGPWDRLTITSDGDGATVHVDTQADRSSPIEWTDATIPPKADTYYEGKYEVDPLFIPGELETDAPLRRARAEWDLLRDRIKLAVQRGEWHHRQPNTIDDAIDKLVAAVLKNEERAMRRAAARQQSGEARAARAREALLPELGEVTMEQRVNFQGRSLDRAALEIASMKHRLEKLEGVQPAPAKAMKNLRKDGVEQDRRNEEMARARRLHDARMEGPPRTNPGDAEVLDRGAAAKRIADGVSHAIMGKPVALVYGDGGENAYAMGFDTEGEARAHARSKGLIGFEIRTTLTGELEQLAKLKADAASKDEPVDPIRAASGSDSRMKSVLEVAKKVASGQTSPEAGRAAVLAGGYSDRIADLVTSPEQATAAFMNRRWEEHEKMMGDVLERLTKLEMLAGPPILKLDGVATGTIGKGFGQVIRTGGSVASVTSEALEAVQQSAKTLGELRAELDKVIAQLDREEPAPFPAYVELMGHRQVVAMVSAERVGGRVMQTLRWTDSTGREWVKHFGGSAIFSITPLRDDEVEMVKSNLGSTPAYEYTGVEYSLLRHSTTMGSEPSSKDYREEGLQDEGDDESNEDRGGIPF